MSETDKLKEDSCVWLALEYIAQFVCHCREIVPGVTKLFQAPPLGIFSAKQNAEGITLFGVMESLVVLLLIPIAMSR